MKTYDMFISVQAQFPEWAARLEDANLDCKHADMEEAHRLEACAPNGEAQELIDDFIFFQVKLMLVFPVQ